jgi:hypothetical protein
LGRSFADTSSIMACPGTHWPFTPSAGQWRGSGTRRSDAEARVYSDIMTRLQPRNP